MIGSDSGAIPGVIGEAGLIVPEGDAAALRHALEQVRDQPTLRHELVALGRRRFLSQFTHESIARATVEVYRDLLALRS